MSMRPLRRIGVLTLALIGMAAAGAPAATSGQFPSAVPSVDPFIAPADASASARSAQPVAKPKGGGGKVVVDDDRLDCPDATFTTIQAAVDSGAKDIKVCAGTYAENVVISGDVKLKGDGAASTWVTGVAGTAGPIIDVLAGSKVNIEKLAVDGGSAMAGGVVYGIRYDAADGKIKEVDVLNIRNPAGNSQGIGVRVQSTSGAKTKVTVERSLVANYTRVGIIGNGAGVDLHVHGNVVTGPALPRVWAPNGIQISRGAKGKVHENLVDNNPSPNLPGGAGSGIIVLCAGKTDVHKNTVRDADFGISISDNVGAKVHDNLVQGSLYSIMLQFLGHYWGPSFGCGISPLRNNDVHKNTLLNSGVIGIGLSNVDTAALDPGSPRENRIHDNRIDGSVAGIYVWDGIDNKFEKNEIDNSSYADAGDLTSGGGTAGTANEWKKNKCSTSLPAGLC